MIMTALHTDFYFQLCSCLKLLKQVGNFFLQAIRTCAYYQSFNACGQCFFILLTQHIYWSIRTTVGLEICDVLHILVFLSEEPFACFQLLCNAFCLTAIVRGEGIVTAVTASSASNGSISVWTSKTAINHYALKLGHYSSNFNSCSTHIPCFSISSFGLETERPMRRMVCSSSKSTSFSSSFAVGRICCIFRKTLLSV